MFNLLMKKLELFCEASGSKIFVAKSIHLGGRSIPLIGVLNLDSAGVVLTRSLGTLESPFLLILVLMICGIG